LLEDKPSIDEIVQFKDWHFELISVQ
jgi:hypothetical protein